MANGGFESQSFELNGQTYQSLDEVPQPFRDSIAALMADRDGNGVPDVFEGAAEQLHVAHRTSETYEVDGVRYSSLDQVPEPQRSAVRQALERHGSSTIDDETMRPMERYPSSAPIAPNPIITPAGRSGRWKLLASFIAIDAIVILLAIWLLSR